MNTGDSFESQLGHKAELSVYLPEVEKISEAQVLSLKTYIDALTEAQIDTDSAYTVFTALIEGENLHGEQFYNIEVLRKFDDDLADRDDEIIGHIQAAQEALEARYRSFMGDAAQDTQNALSEHPGLYGVRADEYFDPILSVELEFGDTGKGKMVAHAASGEQYSKVPERLVIINQRYLPDDKRAVIDRYRELYEI